MINIKESCRTCSKLNRCVKIIEYNVNNILLPAEKKWTNCIDFEHLESVVENCVMYNIQDALMDYDAKHISNFTPIGYAKMLPELEILKVIKKIKVTSRFYNMLRNLFDRKVLYGISSPLETFQGIPIEIDDTIENEYYELVY